MLPSPYEDTGEAGAVPLVLHSRLLANIPNVVHGFVGAAGGVSTGNFESLNLSLRVGDERERVMRNRQWVLETIGARQHRFINLNQVHGDAVVQVTRNAGKQIKADALWTRDRAAAIAVLTADCVPILLADRIGSTVCAVHAGWKGTKSKIVSKALAALQEAGIAPENIVAAIGPCISFEAFEIGSEVADELRAALGESTAIENRAESKARADLQVLNQMQLLEAGVPQSQLEILPHCTLRGPGFFSYRRDAGQTGRQGSMIALV